MHGPACIFWANLTPVSLQLRDSLSSRQAVSVTDTSFGVPPEEVHCL
jgi:hypothetical protein